MVAVGVFVEVRATVGVRVDVLVVVGVRVIVAVRVSVGVRVIAGVRVPAAEADSAIGEGISSAAPIARPTPNIINQMVTCLIFQPCPCFDLPLL